MLEREYLAKLHESFLANRDDAFDVMWEFCYQKLKWELVCQYPGIEEQMISDAVTDALREYREKPDHYDPKRNVPLDRYLARNARCNLINAFESQQRRQTRESAWMTLQEQISPANFSENDPPANFLLRSHLTQLEQVAWMLTHLKNPIDREVLKLWFTGERSVASYAFVMGIADQPENIQRLKVKNCKNRILKMLRRFVAAYTKI